MPETKRDDQALSKNGNTASPDECLAAEAESAAARDEPMGSVAAAVPGSNKLAQDAIHSDKRPGAESPEMRDQPKTTAGTEAKLPQEEKQNGDANAAKNSSRNAA